MTDRQKDMIFGCLMLGFGLIWTWLVWSTIPPAFDSTSVGPRAFPLGFGFILIGLSIVLLVHSAARDNDNSGLDVPAEADTPLIRRIRWGAMALVLIETCAYGFLLEKIGFLLATPLVVLAVMVVNLRIRSLRLLAGMSIGLTLGCWLIFQKLMGIYLASGSWINLW